MLNCEINLNVVLGSPNHDIKGTIAVRSDKHCTIEYITAEIVGYSECKFTLTKHLIKFLRIYRKGVKFYGKRNFFSSLQTLGGERNSFMLKDEYQNFSFKFSIPDYLPSTWRGEFGIIQYTLNVIVKQENLSHLFEKDFQINPHRNLSLEHRFYTEVLQKVSRKYRYGFINLGDVEVEIWLPLSGIAAGQKLPVHCTIFNQSSIFFGGLIFVLTQIEVYRSTTPTKTVKLFRKDICRIPQMVDILEGVYEFYCVLETNSDTPPTNQYTESRCCQVVYEMWLSIQGSLPRYKHFGYPNIDTPGIPIIVGNVPMFDWDMDAITNEVRGAVFDSQKSTELDTLQLKTEVQKILNAEEEIDTETVWNISRQLTDSFTFLAKQSI